MADVLSRDVLISYSPTVLVFTLIWALLQTPGARGQCAVLGTTPGIREIMIGKCLQYHALYLDEFCENGISTRKNCTGITDYLLSAFTYQPTCNVTFTRYDDFIRAAHMDVPSGKTMFWSDVYDVVRRYRDDGQRARPIETTLIGYLGDGLKFCAQETDPGLIYGQECAGWDQTETCPKSAELSFWAVASINFASTARGDVRLMLNASFTEAFYNTSFFGVWELPNIDPSRVTKLTILLVHIPGQEIRSTCKSDNIDNLQDQLKARNISSACEDSPWDVQIMICADYPDAGECRPAKSETTSAGTYIHDSIRLVLAIFTAFTASII